MIPENLSILYVGNQSNGVILPVLEKHLRDDWYLYVAQEVGLALGMYIFYLPHLVIFEGRSTLVDQVFYHISSVMKPSPRIIDGILVVADEPLGPTPPATILRQYPASITEAELLAAITRLARDCTDAVSTALRGASTRLRKS
jgi:hypothetical protein